MVIVSKGVAMKMIGLFFFLVISSNVWGKVEDNKDIQGWKEIPVELQGATKRSVSSDKVLFQKPDFREAVVLDTNFDQAKASSF